MLRRNVGVAGKGELTEAPTLTPLAQLPTDWSDGCLHAEKLDEPGRYANYLQGNSFFTFDVIAFLRQVGEISQRGRMTMPRRWRAQMDELNELIDRYVTMWNETDAERRRALIARIWTEDARHVDPVLDAKGQAGIDEMICGVHQRFPGHRVRRTGNPDAHHDRVRFTWELAPEGGPAVVKGVDFAVVDGQRLQSVTGFFDYVATS